MNDHLIGLIIFIVSLPILARVKISDHTRKHHPIYALLMQLWILLGTIAIAILVIYRLSIKDWAFLILTPSILTLIFYWLIGRRKKEFFDKRIFLVIWLFFLLTILSNPVSAILSGGGDESYS